VLEELVRNLQVNLRRQSIGLVVIGGVMVLLADAGVRNGIASARQNIGVYTQRLGIATPLLIAVGLFALVLFLA
jgi:hypothetical protein